MDVKISPRWKELLGAEFEKPYFAELVRFVKQEYATRRVFFPPGATFSMRSTCATRTTSKWS